MVKGKVIIMAGGTGVTIPYINTIENKVSKDEILNCIRSNGKSDPFENKIRDIQEDSFSIWGYSENDKNLKNNAPNEDDIIFITNHDAAIYLVTVLGVFKSNHLDAFWAGRRSWNNLIIFKSVIRVFIPYYTGKNVEEWIRDHPFSPGLSSLKYVEKRLNNNDSFRNIIGREDKSAHIQGALKLKLSAEEVLNNLFKYCMRTHFECLVKEI